MSNQTTHSLAPLNARELLRNALFANANCEDALRLARDLPSSCDGVMVAGQARFQTVRSIRHARPDLAVFAQPPDPSNHVATLDQPWAFEAQDGLFEHTLSTELDDQITRHCSIAITPTGFIEAASSATLKKILTETDRLDRRDMVVWLPLSVVWLTSDTDRRQLIAALRKWDRHPVALSFGHTSNPFETKKAVEGLVDVLDSIPGVSMFRTDHVGVIETLVRSSGASTFGLLPSHRRLNLPGKTGFAIDKSEKRPNVGYPELHRFIRSPRLAEIFVNTIPPSCTLAGCDARPLDSYSGSNDDRYRAHLHNLRWVTQLHAQIRGVEPPNRPKALVGIYQNASDAHARLSRRVGRQMKVPLDLRTLLALAVQSLATQATNRANGARRVVPIAAAPSAANRPALGTTTQSAQSEGG